MTYCSIGRFRTVPLVVTRLEAAARRIHHIRLAAQNLKMAEVHDLAHQLMQKAEAMEREMQDEKNLLALLDLSSVGDVALSFGFAIDAVKIDVSCHDCFLSSTNGF